MATAKTAAKKAAKTAPARMTLAEAMESLEKAGTAQARKTYARHGATGPMFGTSFAHIATMVKRIGVDQGLAEALWDTGNVDARNLAMKVADPARMTPALLDRWAGDLSARMCAGYIAMLAAEGPHAAGRAEAWLASPSEKFRAHGWNLLGQMASRDATAPDSLFAGRVAVIEKTIHAAPNSERAAMNQALIAIGGRSAALRKAALAAAKRIGKVEVDHGDTSCKTPDATEYLAKYWAHAEAKGFESPAAQERNRESPRTRC